MGDVKQLTETPFGTKPLKIELPSAFNVPRSTESMRGKLGILLYDSVITREQNTLFHAAISQSFQADPTLLNDFDLMIVLNFGPMIPSPELKGIVMKHALPKVQEQSQALKIDLYIDEEGAIAEHFKLDQGLSQIVILDEEGVVVLHMQGSLGEEGTKEAIEALTDERRLFRERRAKRMTAGAL